MFTLHRAIVPIAGLGLAVFALSAVAGGGNQDKPADKALDKEKKSEKADKAEKPPRKFEVPKIDVPNFGGGSKFLGGPFGRKSEKFPDASLQIPSVKKLKDAEDAYRQARDAALKDIDAALEKAEADLAKAYKDIGDKDADKRAKAQTESAKLSQDVSNLKSARMRASIPYLPVPLPQESRLAARLEKVGDLTAAQLKLEKGQGLVVLGLEKDGAADKAGLKVNDIIIAIDGKNVTSEMKDLRKILVDIQPDAKVAVTVLRAGAREQIGELKLPAVASK